jgi:hypothetical protein
MFEDGLMATIEKISPDEICLKLSELGPRSPLKEGGRVRIKSWTEEALYFWDAKVLEMSNSAKESLTVSIFGDGVTLQRRDRSGRYNPSTQRRPNR